MIKGAHILLKCLTKNQALIKDASMHGRNFVVESSWGHIACNIIINSGIINNITFRILLVMDESCNSNFYCFESM